MIDREDIDIIDSYETRAADELADDDDEGPYFFRTLPSNPLSLRAMKIAVLQGRLMIEGATEGATQPLISEFSWRFDNADGNIIVSPAPASKPPACELKRCNAATCKTVLKSSRCTFPLDEWHSAKKLQIIPLLDPTFPVDEVSMFACEIEYKTNGWQIRNIGGDGKQL